LKYSSDPSMTFMEKAIKIILATLFFTCLLHMPYGYYQFVRVVALIGFALLAYQANEGERHIEVIVFIGLAVLFQPLFKIPLGRVIWNIVDVTVGLSLLITLFVNKRHLTPCNRTNPSKKN